MRLWALPSRRLLRSLDTDLAAAVAIDGRGHAAVLTSALSGKSMVVTLRLWDARTGRSIGTRPVVTAADPAHDGAPQAAVWVDGRTVAVVGLASEPLVVDLEPKRWQARACAITSRNLTAAEWSRYVGPGFPYERTSPRMKPLHTPPTVAGSDFFISYTEADRDWAATIAEQLRPRASPCVPGFRLPRGRNFV